MDHIQRREMALRGAGIDPSIMAPEVFTAVELKLDPPPPPPNNPHGLPYREETRRTTDAEWSKIGRLLPDANNASLTNRRWLDMMLRFVISGDSWTKLGGRDNGVREKRRRHRGDKRWDDAGNVALQTFDDIAFAEQVARTCRWITHNDVSVLALRRGIGPSIRRWKVVAGSPTKPLA